jgi:hypothetical protein
MYPYCLIDGVNSVNPLDLLDLIVSQSKSDGVPIHGDLFIYNFHIIDRQVRQNLID